VVIDAREVAEAGARAALEALAVNHYEPYSHMKPDQRELRNKLRARARQLGDSKLAKPDSSRKDHKIDHLVNECAYEHWHRMLFARFLAENGLLIEPQEKMAISLAEAEELAKEDGVDVWVFASRCAQGMLPQIFRPDDPLLQVTFATEHMLKLERLLASLPQAVFAASDALGWVYQFWQSKKKDEINQSEVKIGADEISAVTQLFTEPYMVEFLLHNTLGAWWAGKRLALDNSENTKSEEEVRRKVSLPGVSWEYFRFVRSSPSPSTGVGQGEGSWRWRPAAGTFDGWPKAAKDIRVIDPCCGSGHFLVSALHHLVPIRIAEEEISARDAIDGVLRENLHGLEIDERCCQIAAFALAFAAWTYPGAGGYRQLPDFHIARCGIGPESSKDQWLRLAEEAAARGGTPPKRNLFGTEETLLSGPVKATLESLYELFSQAPVLGALVNPAALPSDLFHVNYETVAPLLSEILKTESTGYETRERAIAVAGMLKAAELLAGRYTLVITNVPYLARGKQCDVLRDFCSAFNRLGESDLATVFFKRLFEFLAPHGCHASVTPLNWVFIKSYRELRTDLLVNSRIRLIARVGSAVQAKASWDVLRALTVISNDQSNEFNLVTGVQAPSAEEASRAAELIATPVQLTDMSRLLRVPDHRIVFEYEPDASKLEDIANSYQGIATADYSRFGRKFWELMMPSADWEFQQSTVSRSDLYAGRENILWWERGSGTLASSDSARIQGLGALGKEGVAITQTRSLQATLFTGHFFDNNVAALVVNNPDELVNLWCFTSSPNFADEVRRFDEKLGVTNATFLKVPYDRERWLQDAAERFPNGLPEPESDDPTQWLFHGQPEESAAPLQVAVARLLGYHWPAELDTQMRLSNRARILVNRCNELAKFADTDGIVCIPPLRGEEPACEQLEKFMTKAGLKLNRAQLGGMADLDDWLRNGYFQEHCKLFHDRPFVWHIWDGRKRDGFHALVNYHKLCEGDGRGRKLVESLTYSYLGEWIIRQRDGVKRGEGGAEDRLAAALELQKRLEAILEGEPPFDIFVRWKPLSEQPIGWEPDINDGVRLNIRPFLALDLPNGRAGAGILRYKPNIKWGKDRGKEPERLKEEYPWFWGWDEKAINFMGGKDSDGNRWNACHYTNEEKQVAREAAKTEGK
jgi:hypothetical protein